MGQGLSRCLSLPSFSKQNTSADIQTRMLGKKLGTEGRNETNRSKNVFMRMVPGKRILRIQWSCLFPSLSIFSGE